MAKSVNRERWAGGAVGSTHPRSTPWTSTSLIPLIVIHRMRCTSLYHGHPKGAQSNAWDSSTAKEGDS